MYSARIPLLVLALLLVASAVRGGPAEGPAIRAPDVAITNVAPRLWYPPSAHPEAQLALERLGEQIAQRDWAAAITTAEELTGKVPEKVPADAWDLPWQWRVAVAELYLYNAQPDRAVPLLQSVLREVPSWKEKRGALSPVRSDAAYALARARAETGDFVSAIGWLARAPDEAFTGCGNCAEQIRMEAHPVLAVWNKARLPHAQAVPALEAIQAGHYVPMKTGLYPALEAAKVQKKLARDEAALILAELHLRRGETAKAVAQLRIAAKSDQELGFIARTRLRRLEAGPGAR